MRYRTLAGIMWCLVCLCLAPGRAAAAVLTVGGDGWQAYTTIQGAVDDAIDGDVIKVFQGTYAEQVEIRDLDIPFSHPPRVVVTDGSGPEVRADTQPTKIGRSDRRAGTLSGR